MILFSLTKYSFSKVFNCPKQAVKGIKNNDFLMIGGFLTCGLPNNLIKAVKQNNPKNLTVLSNHIEMMKQDQKDQVGIQMLIKNKQVKRLISSYISFNQELKNLYFNGHIQIQYCPQGTLIQKIRSGGAGIPAFYTNTGVDTLVQKGGIPIKYYPESDIPQIISQPKKSMIIDGKKYLLQYSYKADFALIKAKKADLHGNIMFNLSANNFNQDMATAAKCVIAEVEQIVEKGKLSPNQIHLQGIFVDRIYKIDQSHRCSHHIIQKDKSLSEIHKRLNESKIKILKRAAKQIKKGMHVHLGMGIPTLLSFYLDNESQINIHSQNGALGVGYYPQFQKNGQSDLINNSKEPVLLNPGGSTFSSTRSFCIIRGGHLDIIVLGAMQVSEKGDISNWTIPGKNLIGMGSVMDLVESGSKIIIVMQQEANQKKKLLKNCTLPITGKGKASMVITQKAVFQNKNGKLILTQIAQGVSFKEVQNQTGFQIQKAETLKTF